MKFHFPKPDTEWGTRLITTLRVAFNAVVNEIDSHSHTSASDIPFLTATSSTLTADVNIITANTWYAGPSLALSAGTYTLNGIISLAGTATTNTQWSARLGDGIHHIASGHATSPANNPQVVTFALTGITTLTSVTTTIKIDATGDQAGVIKAALNTNSAGNTASKLCALRIA